MAYEAALTLEREETAERAEAPDLDTPLALEDVKKLDASWKISHDWRPIPWMRPSIAFRNRVYREFRARTAQLHTVEKALSADSEKRTQDKARTPVAGLGGGSPYTHQPP